MNHDVTAEQPDEQTEQTTPPQQRERPWTRVREPLERRDRLVFAAILLLTAIAYLARLSAPGRVLPDTHEQCRQVPPRGDVCYELIPLDERHYVPDARDVLAYGTESDTRVAEGEGRSGAYVVHPPVGKWFIAAGIALFGDRPFGWRFFGALLGIAGVALIYAVARSLWRSAWAAAAAALLLAVDGMWFVLSRVAMLDIYAATFTLAAVWALLRDRDRAPAAQRGVHGWRVLAGVFFGLAFATKWSVVPFLAVLGLLAIGWETTKTIEAGPGARWWLRAAGIVGSLMALPLLIYVATYMPWVADDRRYVPPACEDERTVAAAFGCYQVEMLNFHKDLEKFEPAEEDEDEETASPTASPQLEPAHPYFGNAISWPWIGRPVAHAYNTTGKGDGEKAAHVLGLPNVVTWPLGFFLGLPALVWFAVRRDTTASLLLGFFAAGWVPYLIADVVGRPVFMFYATPLVPFVVLSVVHVGMRARERLAFARWVAVAVLSLALVAFAWFYPVLAAYPVDTDSALGWKGRIWMNLDCLEDERIRSFCWI